MLIRLGDLLRMTLDTAARPEIRLSEEMDFLSKYLQIEQVRLGDRLGVSFDVDNDVLDAVVPALILQPLVENAIKHGLTRKVGTGRITIRSRRGDNVLVLDVEDDGLGISDERLQTAMSSGIGLSNVNERLRVIYGATARVILRGAPGRGATAHLEMPILVAQEQASA
jgi:sensor histidine kinase YesM